jgi:hypothetical protein
MGEKEAYLLMDRESELRKSLIALIKESAARVSLDPLKPILENAELMGSRGRARKYGRPEPEDRDHDYVVFSDDADEQAKYSKLLRQLGTAGYKLHDRPGGFLTASGNNTDLSIYPTSKRDDIHKAWELIEGGMSKDDAWEQVEKEKDVYVQSAVPATSRDLVKKHGLLSSQALVNNPEALEAFLADRAGTDWEEDEEAFKKRIEEKLKDAFWGDSMKGPSVFFGDPDPAKITDAHPMRKLKAETIRVNLSKLLRDYPKTRIAGTELQPYDPEGPEHQGDLRHYDIDMDKVREYAATDPKELWKHYDDPEGVRYAGNVPHAQIITPSGGIPLEYLDFGEKQAEEKEPWRIERSAIHGKGLFATQDIPAGGRVAHSASLEKDDVGLEQWELSEAARYTNHSRTPNTKVDSDGSKMTMVATEPIDDGEEIRVSYFQVGKSMFPGQRLTHGGRPMRTVSTEELSKWAKDIV